MLVPLIGIFLASAVIWPILSVLTVGLSDYVSEAATAAFITLIGIRTALSLKGDHRNTDFKSVALYSVSYGVLLSIAKSVMILAAFAVILLIADTSFINLSAFMRNPESAEEIVQRSFDQVGLPWNMLILTPFLVATPVLFAVPMAAIAQSSGHGAHSEGLFWGIGKCFVPLFIIFTISYALQFFFGLLSFIYLMLPALIVALSAFINAPETFSVDLSTISRGLMYFAALLTAQAWLWSAAALAFLSTKRRREARAPAPQDAVADMAMDLRSLRKSRQHSRD